MQNLTITTPEYKNLEHRFKDWLRLLNFEPSTIKYAPLKVREFLGWLENNQIREITAVTKPIISNYFTYLKTRQNKRKGGKLSKNYLRTHLTALRKLSKYLRETGQESFEVDLQLPGNARNIKAIFTLGEIKALYNVCISDILGIRDKAILAVYYGCGLRRNEGANLDIEDVLFDRNLLYVRKGKNYKERYVPMSAGVREDLQNYIDFARPVLIKTTTKALFLGNQYGNRLGSSSIANRLQNLKGKAEINKEAGLHALRHSIATHLLESGMELQQIKRFLGHSSLESTQIYTHICDHQANTIS
jgi:site-specific recombinase XerD